MYCTKSLVEELKNRNSDYQFYPTPDNIISRVIVNMANMGKFNANTCSILDCGCGDGRVLQAVKNGNYKNRYGEPEKFNGELYAIEKADLLLEQLDPSIFVVGNDFFDTNIMDSKYSVIFSNPPFRIYEKWCERLINDANCHFMYLVLPQSWKQSKKINDVITKRQATFEVLDSYDFRKAERYADIDVDLIRLDFYKSGRLEYGENPLKIDPFDLWFSENFKLNETCCNDAAFDLDKKLNNEIISRENLSLMLVDLYNKEMNDFLETFRNLTEIKSNLLVELGIDIDNIKTILKNKCRKLKQKYWEKLFTSLDSITSKLTTESRKSITDKLYGSTGVDFTLDNIKSIVLWTVKNANQYFDTQLIDVYKRLASCADIVRYKSNQKTIDENGWRYTKKEYAYNREVFDRLERYKLEYRVIYSCRVALLKSRDCSFNTKYRSLLSDKCCDLVNDLMVVGLNLGFDTTDNTLAQNLDWTDGTQKFNYFNHTKDCVEPFMTVRACLNGSLQIKFNTRFMCNFNTEFGRLCGWLQSASQVANELDLSKKDLKEMGFSTNEDFEKIFNNNFKFQSNKDTLIEVGLGGVSHDRLRVCDLSKGVEQANNGFEFEFEQAVEF